MAKEHYTAIIHVHGIGQRARHEDIGGLIESLESFQNPIEPGGVGELRDFHEKIEPSRSLPDPSPDVPFTQFKRVETKDLKHRFRGNYRGYEVYWSPITGRGQSPWTMLFWLIKQLIVPPRYLFANWRYAFRLRIARLHRLNETAEFPEAAVIWMLAQFKRFLGTAGRRDSPNARFIDFRQYLIRSANGTRWEAAAPRLAKRWNECRTPGEGTAAILIWQVFGLAIATFLWMCLCIRDSLPSIIEWFSHGARGAGTLYAFIQTLPAVSVLSMIGLAVMLGLVLFMLVFLARTASDIRLWASFRENDKNYRLRRAIIDQAKQTIAHVIKDELCTRTVIVAHSLGTSIVYDALRELGLYNSARESSYPDRLLQLSKISHLITLGSPIDKIAYFFESKDSDHYRANRIRETVRGDLSREPFYRNSKEQIAWINLWDDADIICDPLYSPLSQKHDGSRFSGSAIQNIRVATKFFPNPYTAHSSYLQNRTAISIIFGSIFFNDAWRFAASHEVPIPLRRRSDRLLRLGARLSFPGFVASSTILAASLFLRTYELSLIAMFVLFLAFATICICFFNSLLASFRNREA